MRFYGIIGTVMAAALGLLLWVLFPYFSGKPLEPEVLKILVPALLVAFLFQEQRMRVRSGVNSRAAAPDGPKSGGEV